jgi:hypothetical protein
MKLSKKTDLTFLFNSNSCKSCPAALQWTTGSLLVVSKLVPEATTEIMMQSLGNNVDRHHRMWLRGNNEVHPPQMSLRGNNAVETKDDHEGTTAPENMAEPLHGHRRTTMVAMVAMGITVTAPMAATTVLQEPLLRGINNSKHRFRLRPADSMGTDIAITRDIPLRQQMLIALLAWVPHHLHPEWDPPTTVVAVALRLLLPAKDHRLQ